MTSQLPSNIKKPALILLGIVVLIAVGFLIYRTSTTIEMASNGSETGAFIPSEAWRSVDIAAIRTFMGDERYGATFMGTSSPSNFTVGRATVFSNGGGGQVDIPDEWKRVVNKYESTQTLGAK